jgi:hypothetical protein
MSNRNRTAESPIAPSEERKGALERHFIEQYLREKGHTLQSILALAEEESERLLAAASKYASGRLAEMETRARFVRVIRGDSGPTE